MSCVSAPSLRPLSLHSPEHDCPLCEALGVGVFAYRALAEELGSDDPARLDPIWRERCQARVDAYNQRLRVDAEIRDKRDESASINRESQAPGSLEQLCLSTDGLWTLGRVARITRESLRLTRVQLATLAGVADSTVRNFETGRHRPRDRCLLALLDALITAADSQSLRPPFLDALRDVLRHACGLPPTPKPEDPPTMTADPPQNPEPFGKTAQRRRIAVGMTQTELAMRAGLSFSNLKAIESGHVDPTDAQRRNINAVLHEAEHIPRPTAVAAHADAREREALLQHIQRWLPAQAQRDEEEDEEEEDEKS